MEIKFCDLQKQHTLLRSQIDQRLQKVIAHTQFINGPEIGELEEKLRAFLGVKHAVCVSSGTDALFLSLLALQVQPGDFVITTPFTFVATAEVISLLGAYPVFVDIEPDTFNISPDKLEQFLKFPKLPCIKGAISREKIKAVIAVDLFGQCADYDQILQTAKHYGLLVIEDGAQSFGALYKESKSCTLGDISCTSFFPAKPLGCFGDGGALFTNNDPWAERLKLLRNHGQEKRYNHSCIGLNARLDTLQAAVLLAKFETFLSQETKLRQSLAEKYCTELAPLARQGFLALPVVKPFNRSIWAQFSICTEGSRDLLKDFLQSKGVPTAVHYPKPLHLQDAFAYLGYTAGDFPVAEAVARKIISLPFHPYLSDDDFGYICLQLKNHYSQGSLQ